MKELDFLRQYSDAAKHSTDRTRQVFLLMIAASILIYAASWNSGMSGWANARLALARATERILSHEEERKKNPLIGELQVPRGKAELYAFAKENIEWSGITLYQAQQNLNQIQQVRGEQINHIQVPMAGFGGINFDVNDLAMFGGFTLLVLLVWEYYSLWHYADNLTLAFDHAREIGAKELNVSEQKILLYHTYQDLAMHQVLTIPPRPASKNQETSQLQLFLRQSPRVMYTLPLVVQTLVVFHDWLTIDIGRSVNSRAAVTVLFVGTTIWLILAVFTALCFYILRKTDITWQRIAKTI